MSTSRRKPPVKTLEPLTAFDRDKRLWALRESYARGERPRPPRTKHELDVLKEHHQFVRTQDGDRSTLSWEDQLAAKYYDSLFKEFAIVNLKHWKTGQIGLRWRTEDEVLSGIGHSTCASMRCAHHLPDPVLVAQAEEDAAADADGSIDRDRAESDRPRPPRPLVPTRLDESEMNFGYVEHGQPKSALVKVVLCRECSKRLRRGRETAKAERTKQLEERRVASRRTEPAAAGHETDEVGAATGRGTTSGVEQSSVDRTRRVKRSRSDRRDSSGDERESRRPTRDGIDDRHDEDGGDEYVPALPPDMVRRSRSPPRSLPRRRSASPRRRHPL